MPLNFNRTTKTCCFK